MQTLFSLNAVTDLVWIQSSLFETILKSSVCNLQIDFSDFSHRSTKESNDSKLSEYLCAANFGTPAHSAHKSFLLPTVHHHTCAFFDNFATPTPAHFTGTPKIECFICYTCVVSNHTLIGRRL